jgi:hypothetical protein
MTSGFYYSGTSHAIIIGTGYYNHHRDFAVIGNLANLDGMITLEDGSNGYSKFSNIASIYHGRHGVRLKETWATQWVQCRFDWNEGVGIYLDGTGSIGVSNGVSFIQCLCRNNGGNSTATTFNDAKGGVYISGCASAHFIGGIYESNNAWNFIWGGSVSSRVTVIEKIYAEICPSYANEGGMFYLGGAGWNYIKVIESSIAWGTTKNYQTGHLVLKGSQGEGNVGEFYIDGSNHLPADAIGTNKEIPAYAWQRQEKREIDRGNRWELFEDFNMPALSETVHPVILNNNAGTDPAIPSNEEMGFVRISTPGTGSGNGGQILLSIPVQADSTDLIFEARVRLVNNNDQVLLVMGLTDNTAWEIPAEETAGVITTNMSNGCVVVYDSGAAVDDLYYIGVADNTDATGNGLTTGTPGVNQWLTYRIEIASDGSTARFYLNNVLVKTLTANAVNPSVNLYATVLLAERSASVRECDVDYIKIGHYRDRW